MILPKGFSGFGTGTGCVGTSLGRVTSSDTCLERGVGSCKTGRGLILRNPEVDCNAKLAKNLTVPRCFRITHASYLVH